ncbi:MAG: putative D,D-heptose 1,7-bisphosphate phosphatase [Pseudonocardiales bacterium]|nr:putative D,D-heptose 1,7-bisphosphate phosphatase [Pseudonocardiales bacterium]
MGRPSLRVVIPTIGRPSLSALLDSLEASAGPLPDAVVVVDDRPGPPHALDLGLRDAQWAALITVRRSGGRGPAAARNSGWLDNGHPCRQEWIAFLDDDVLVDHRWLSDLAEDLRASDAGVGGSQGEISVPLPTDRRPTDWERGTAGLAASSWITADMAYRTTALTAVGGFDERFPRAFREDADLALRVEDAGWSLARGTRRATHPVRPAPWNASLRQQRGNADDVLMAQLHGRHWRLRAHAPRGRRRTHLATAAAGAGALGALGARRYWAAAALGCAWAASTARFAWVRIAPGPRTRDEVAAMAATSVAIPFAASGHWLLGMWRHRDASAWSGRVPPPPPVAVFVDRDGTIVHDVPYNGDPDKVRPIHDALAALGRLRAAGIAVGVITNQSGIARGILSREQVQAVNDRVEQMLGPFDVWLVCPHGPDDGCSCRKPLPGMVLDGARKLGVRPEQCAVIGDIDADISAAAAAGAIGILVPNGATRPEEIANAGLLARTLDEAVDLLIGAA